MKGLTILLLVTITVLSLQAQDYANVPEEKRNLPSFMYNDAIHEMGIEYKLPKGFKHKYKEVSTNPDFWGVIDGLVESNDKEFFIIFSVPGTYNKKDSIELSMLTSQENRYKLSPNARHLNRINNDIKRISYYKQTPPDIDKELIYYSSTKAKEFYNADTVITYNINIKDFPYNYTLSQDEPEIFDLNKHKYCKAIIIQKKDRNFLAMYCFYSDKAAKKTDKYINGLKGMFWYREQ